MRVPLPNQCAGLLLEQEARAVAKWLGVDFAKIARPKYMSYPLVKTVRGVPVVSISEFEWVLKASARKRLAVAPTGSVGLQTEAGGMLYALPLSLRPKSQWEKEFPRAKLPDGFIGTIGFALLSPSLRHISFTENAAVAEVAKTIRITYPNGSPIGAAVSEAVIAEMRRRPGNLIPGARSASISAIRGDCIPKQPLRRSAALPTSR
jgi:hypothetical protein